uniref:Uncharacterized protein n=1 Tax=Moorena bouillonii PNG TaxID=568701 RepID=A0A0H4U5B3_9CYAN|nr:hypothetical protein [Moorena bouillonii PNG]
MLGYVPSEPAFDGFEWVVSNGITVFVKCCFLSPSLPLASD